MKIEFFHDVICSFCFPMSYRMRQLKEKHPDLEIIHRSFALVPEEKAFDMMFGSRKNAKDEILSHWQAANMNDDLHRFNIEGMKNQDFLFPTSIPALRTVAAAELVAGHEVAWDVFDALQNSLFVENKNVEDISIIESAVASTTITMSEWQEAYKDEKSLTKVHQDLALAQSYGITGVPFVVVNEKYGINGAQPLANIEALIEKIKTEENKQPLQMMTHDEGEACALDEEGKWNCD